MEEVFAIRINLVMTIALKIEIAVMEIRVPLTGATTGNATTFQKIAPSVLILDLVVAEISIARTGMRIRPIGA